MNTASNQALALVYEGSLIRTDDEMISLTDMWKASGAPASKLPANWLRTDSVRDFVTHISSTFSQSVDSHFEVIRTVRGGNEPGSWAHWQVALSYAKHLSPAFHVWCNQIVRDHMTRQSAPPPPLSGVHLREMVQAVVEEIVEARLAHDPRTAIKSMVSVKELLDDEKVEPKGRRGLIVQCSARLREHCYALAGDATPLRCARTRTWLFPVAVAREWMAKEGRGLIVVHRARLAGQTFIDFSGGDA